MPVVALTCFGAVAMRTKGRSTSEEAEAAVAAAIVERIRTARMIATVGNGTEWRRVLSTAVDVAAKLCCLKPATTPHSPIRITNEQAYTLLSTPQLGLFRDQKCRLRWQALLAHPRLEEASTTRA
jgi:hypothetical protein